jgi:AbrB family looped-hinge helix DNA binding protein
MFEAVAMTKMSSRGQVVIPENVRDELGLKTGSQFVIIGQGDVVMLKLISPPSMDDYNELKRRLRRQAREAGLSRSDIDKAVKKVRGPRK